MSEKNRDDKNRWRNVTIAFRMSPEENEELNNRVKLSGFRTKQDYIIQSVLHQKVVATGNPLMLVQFRQNLQRIEHELERIEKASDMDGELLTPIRSMLEILEGFKEQPRTLADMKHLTQVNKAVRDDAPNIYFGKALEQCENKKIAFGNISDREAFMKNLEENSIPKSVVSMTVKDYDVFLAERRALMSQLIEKYYKGL